MTIRALCGTCGNILEKCQCKNEREKMDNKGITITEATARRAMLRLGDWLEWVEDMDKETRADVVALDELIKALDAEDSFQKEIEEKRENARKLNEEYQARKKETAGE